MTYTVSHGASIGPLAIDPCRTLEDAKMHAQWLLCEGRPNVAISDGKGNAIFGDDLVACCNDEKTLTPDLRAI